MLWVPVDQKQSYTKFALDASSNRAATAPPIQARATHSWTRKSARGIPHGPAGLFRLIDGETQREDEAPIKRLGVRLPLEELALLLRHASADRPATN
jgi:hypothetical protein